MLPIIWLCLEAIWFTLLPEVFDLLVDLIGRCNNKCYARFHLVWEISFKCISYSIMKNSIVRVNIFWAIEFILLGKKFGKLSTSLFEDTHKQLPPFLLDLGRRSQRRFYCNPSLLDWGSIGCWFSSVMISSNNPASISLSLPLIPHQYYSVGSTIFLPLFCL